MASSFNDSYVMAVVASLLTLSCAPPAASPDVGVNTTSIDDVGTDASYDWPDAFAFDASLDDILCTGMPVPRGLPCEPQSAAVASGCGGMGRVVYAGNEGCRLATGASCGAIRGAFSTLEECAMACGRLGRDPYAVEYFPASSSGMESRRRDAFDFAAPCSVVVAYRGMWGFESSRCAHLGLLAPLHSGTTTRVDVPPTMSNQEIWELLNAAEMMPRVTGGSGVLCLSPL